VNEVLKVAVSLSLSGSLVALLIFALKPLIKNRLSKTWHYYIWLVVILRLLIPFSPEINMINSLFQYSQQARASQSLPIEGSPSQSGLEDMSIWPQNTDETDTPDPVIPLGEMEGEDIDIPYGTGIINELVSSIWLLWLGVALLMLVRKVTSYRSFVRYIRAGCHQVDSPALDALQRASNQLGIRNCPPIYINTLASSPMLVGIFRPFIVLPALDGEAQNIENIMLHELMHYRRQDILYKWLAQVAVCLHWYNPIVYLVANEIGKYCELSCDEMVIRITGDDRIRDYGDTLLASLKTGGHYNEAVASVTLSEDAKLMKERLGALMQFSKKSKIIIALTVVLTILLLCGATFAGAYLGTYNSKNGSQPADKNLPDGYSMQDSSVPAQASSTTESSVYVNQFHVFENQYLIGIRWQNNRNNRYPHILEISTDKTFQFAFSDETVTYREDPNVEAALQAYAASKYYSNYTSGVYNITEVLGPYDESAEELAEQFYRKDISKFWAVIQKTDYEVQVQYAGKAFYDNQVDYFALLVDETKEDLNCLSLAKYAIEKNEAGSNWVYMFALVYDLLSEDEAKELLEISYNAKDPSFFYFLTDAFPAILDYNDWARRAIQDQKEEFLYYLIDHIDASRISELLEEAYSQRLEDIFYILADRYSDQIDYAAWAERALLDGLDNLFYFFCDDLEDEVLARLAQIALENDSDTFHSIIWSMRSPKDHCDTLIQSAYDARKEEMFWTLAQNISTEKAMELAYQVCGDGEEDYVHYLLQLLSPSQIKELKDKAFEEKKEEAYRILDQYLG